MPRITHAAPQLFVAKVDDALAFYRDRLGFAVDFVYGGFYASVSRDGAVLHLKCSAKPETERAWRRAEEHLDAYLAVTGVHDLHAELAARGAPITQPPEPKPWGTTDFLVEDPDGNRLCFSENT